MLAKHQGITLLEIILVLAIAASVMVLGFRQYASYQNDQNAQRIKNNVNVLFQAASVKNILYTSYTSFNFL